MKLTRLVIHHVRNLHDITLLTHPQLNLFLGPNGSGKTSLLEAIYLLALGRSFRSRHAQSLITYQQEKLACYGEIMDEEENRTTLGFERTHQGETQCKLAGERCEKLSIYAKCLPVQLITPDSFKLLQAGPDERRRFLDWGAFYSDPRFAQLCLRYQRLLKQRNAALKQPAKWHSFAMWNKELAATGEEIALTRQIYFQQLLPFIVEKLAFLLPTITLAVELEQGWQQGILLEQALEKSFNVDQRFGYTTVGPHRADVSVSYQHYAAKEILSRGQQKLLICALYLAQAHQLDQALNKKCLFLLDDLASELDAENRQRLVDYLQTQQHQVFLTGVDPEQWESIYTDHSSKYYLQGGNLSALTNLCYDER